MLELLVLTIVLLALCMAGLGIKMIFRKNGEFSHRCAMKDGGEDMTCGHCATSGRHEDCPKYELHHGNTASRMAKAVEMADQDR